MTSSLDPSRHPCFNEDVKGRFGRVHLPVARRCNIQCNYCDRRYDCANETRPGVTSAVLTPRRALDYLERAVAALPSISVVGIAGPGEPFAEPDETIATLSLVRSRFPRMLLCVSSNGLSLGDHLDELADLSVSHVTITLNAVDPAVGARIYGWVRYKGRVLRCREGAALLLRRQLEAIRGLKDRGITVKVNAIVVPGINDAHIPDVARRAAELGADVLNCIPLYPTAGTPFAELGEPDADTLERVRLAAGGYLPQIRHCARCRADAAGLLGASADPALTASLTECAGGSESRPGASPSRPYVAVATMEGMLVNKHLGEAECLHVYEEAGGGFRFIESRPTPEPGGGDERWKSLATRFADCRALVASGIGANPREVLSASGIRLVEADGLLAEALAAAFSGNEVPHLAGCIPTGCGGSCRGTGLGCG